LDLPKDKIDKSLVSRIDEDSGDLKIHARIYSSIGKVGNLGFGPARYMEDY
jgi:hypothetical protein